MAMKVMLGWRLADRGDAMNGTSLVHLFTETDSFSDIHGAALQRWVANVLRFEEEPAIVACARADSVGAWIA